MMGSSADLISRVDIFKKIINDIEYRSTETSQAEMQRKKTIKTTTNKKAKWNRTSKNCETISKIVSYK